MRILASCTSVLRCCNLSCCAQLYPIEFTNVTIPNNVTSVGTQAFDYCTNLTSVTIGSGVTNIGIYAFYSCTALRGVYFRGNAPSVQQGSFPTTGYLPYAYYLTGTIGWAAFSATTGIPSVLWNPQVQTGYASFGVHANQFGFHITGTADIPIVVESCTNLARAVWTPLQTCTLTNSLVYFSDPTWTNYPNRIYRIRSP